MKSSKIDQIYMKSYTKFYTFTSHVVVGLFTYYYPEQTYEIKYSASMTSMQGITTGRPIYLITQKHEKWLEKKETKLNYTYDQNDSK